MIGSLRGTLLDRSAKGEVLLEVHGVGYRITVAANLPSRIGSVGSDVFLHIHHHFREDDQTLFGFATREERDGFEALLGAHGVGPALALAILSTHGPQELARILLEDDLDALCRVPGVGKKTAARLVVELKARFDIGNLESTLGAASSGSGHAGALGADASARGVVRQALAELGYSPEEVRYATDGLAEEGGESELLRQALRRLG